MTSGNFWNVVALSLAIVLVILVGAMFVPSRARPKGIEVVSPEQAASCGWEPSAPSAGAMRTLALTAAVPVVGSKRVAIVNGSTSQFDTDIGPFWSGLSDGQIAFSTDSFSASFTQSCEAKVDAAAAVAALDDRVDWTQYQYLVIYDSGISCSYQQGNDNVGFNTNDGFVLLGVARFPYGHSAARHEFGHALGLGHAARMPCANEVPMLPGGHQSCGYTIRGDVYSVTGSLSAANINAREKEVLGWWTIPEVGSGTYLLSPDYAHTGLRAIKIRRSSADWMYLEANGGAALVHTLGDMTNFGTYSTPFFQPMLVDGDGGGYPWPLPVGFSLVDPGTGTRVDVLGETGDQLQVQVEAHTPDLVAPQVGLTEPTTGATVTGTVRLLASAWDDVQIYRVRFRVAQDVQVAPGFALDVSDYGTPGQTSFEAQWNTVGLSGPYVIHATAYDMAGNYLTTSAVSVTVGDQIVPTVTATIRPTATTTPRATSTPWPTVTQRVPPGQLKKTKTPTP